MVDQAIKNKTPVFIMGNIDELELLWETLPQQMVMDVFIRPITVGDMVDNVCTQMNDFYQLKNTRFWLWMILVLSCAKSRLCSKTPIRLYWQTPVQWRSNT